ncbi:C-type lectin domain family 7 member A-like [Meles meles]|uniref:C-type lectin domain family 7 member A-like n=1 Tax=Meles meles TaxID=9662 RepID=UPI001E69AC04|nr:C-type lectin domain family 7 member A-like [Meles meles]
MKNFEDSRNLCKTMGSKLVKIEDEKELNFIQNQVSYFTWIGLSRKGIQSTWTWEDNSLPFHKMSIEWKGLKAGKCASLAAKQIAPSDCSRLMHSICAKKINSMAT